MKILITGATGFLGSHLVELMAKEGHEILALVRDEEKFKKLNLPAKPIMGDLQSEHPHEWIKKLPHDLDAVIHNAGIVHSFNPRDFYDVNSRATKQLLDDLAIMFPQTLRFCLISSLSAAGPSQKKKPLKEEDKAHPIGHYGHSKHLAEIYFDKIAPASWKKTIIRPPIIIGPRDEAMVDFFTMVKKGLIIIPGLDGQHKEFSFVCVFDLINTINKALLYNPKKKGPEIFFVAHPRPFTYNELIARVTNLLKPAKRFTIILPNFIIFLAAIINRFIHFMYPDFNFRLTPDKAMELKAPAWICSSNKADELLSINYQWNLEQTLQVTFDDYKNKGKI